MKIINGIINKKCWVIAIAITVLAVHFIYEQSRINYMLNNLFSIQNGELYLIADLMHETTLYINVVTAICLGLLVFNMILYKFWVKSRRWIVEPIVILVLSFTSIFAMHNYNMFEIRDAIELKNKK